MRSTAWSRMSSLREPSFYGLYDEGIVDPIGGRHFQLKTCLKTFDAVIDCTPVGHYIALEAPVAAENICEKPFILRCESAVDLVVGAHEGVWLSLFTAVSNAGK